MSYNINNKRKKTAKKDTFSFRDLETDKKANYITESKGFKRVVVPIIIETVIIGTIYNISLIWRLIALFI